MNIQSILVDGEHWDDAVNDTEVPKVVHVFPLFGREHVMSIDCWCRPAPLPDNLFVYLHNVLH